MPQLHVLISGAGIAGSTLAYWLTRNGFKTTVVERSKELRKEGQMIDIRGLGINVIREMGLEETIKFKTSKEEGIAFVDNNGKSFAEFPVDHDGGISFTSEIEIMRGELAKIFYNASEEGTEYIFGDYVTALKDDGQKVTVDFANGSQRQFDLVVAADGMTSRTRRLTWDEKTESPLRSLGQYSSYFTIPKVDHDIPWARWYNAPGRRMMLSRPDNYGNTRVYLSVMDPKAKEFYKLDVVGQKKLNREIFADAGWEAERFLDGMDASTDFYMQEIAQVKKPSWSKGRIVAVGDAAYCPSPISGMGTTLAIVGAYILAGELGRCSTHEAAFTSYENIFRPLVDDAQNLFPGAPGIANPETTWGIWIMNTILSVMYRTGLLKLLMKLSSTPVDIIKLPEYGY